MQKTSKVKIKQMNKFLSGIHMGNSVFRVYYEQTKDEGLKKIYLRIANIFKEHEEKITKVILKYIDPTDQLTQMESMSLMMEKAKSKMSSDFNIAIMSMKAVHMGTLSATKFIYKHQKLPFDFLECSKKVLKEYDNIETIIKEYVSKVYLNLEIN